MFIFLVGNNKKMKKTSSKIFTVGSIFLIMVICVGLTKYMLLSRCCIECTLPHTFVINIEKHMAKWQNRFKQQLEKKTKETRYRGI